ncbi:MAG: IMPACT family protein [Clostridiales bacterium]|nr:IMPACT family protein [Clostridiales bacterium]
MPNKPYKTLLSQATDTLVINKSRFLCHGKPCRTEEEAVQFIKEKRSEYSDASHNCYAYAIGDNMGIMRYSDDGEPAGTAGLPMMEVIKNRTVTNCCVVITRYFGGILLGSGGLVRAYSSGCAKAIDICGVGTVFPSERIEIDVAYPNLGRLEFFLKSQPVRDISKEFGASVKVSLTVKQQDSKGLISGLIQSLDGKITYMKTGVQDLAWEE